MSKKILPGLNLELGNIYCIGRNYADHAKELGNQVPTNPLVFIKPTNTFCENGSVISLPRQSQDVHHEVELVVAIGKDGKDIKEDEALSYIRGIGVGIDFTARDIQARAKEKGHPWSVAKGFDQFAPVSSFVPYTEGLDIQDLQIQLFVNGENRQEDYTSNMLFPVKTLISYLSGIFSLQAGDLIFTGTPSGVSAIHSGDKVTALLGENLCKLDITIA